MAVTPAGLLSELPLDSVRYLYGLLKGQEKFDYDKATDSALNLLTYLRNQLRGTFAAKAFTTASLTKFTKVKAANALKAIIDHAEGKATAQLSVPPELWGFLLSLLQGWILKGK